MARMPDSVIFVPLRENRQGRRLLVTTFALLAIGVLMVHSALTSVGTPGVWYSRLDIRQTIIAGLAGCVLLSAWLVDYRKLGESRVSLGNRSGISWAAVLFVFACVLGWTVFIPHWGHSVGGYYRWIRPGGPSGPMTFQPSELIKISLVLFLASWLSRKTREDLRSWKRTFLPCMGIIAMAIAPVITEDFGTAALIIMIGTVTMVLAGVPIRHFILPGMLAVTACALFVFQSPHRLARVMVMNEVWSPDNSTAYQPRQSLLAILSGGWFGKGIGNGTVKLGYLPEDSTDFIFSVFCEEWGVVGALVLLGILILWIRHVWQISLEASDRFGQVLAAGLGFLIAAQALLHIGVDTVVLPPTGMSMPFVSAGGTSLVLMAGAVALIVSVSARRNVKDPLL